jgi:GTP-binding protein Era
MHSGYVALVGRPNVGKSTLLNAVIGAKVSIVSAKPQTTRNRISGIFTDPRGQIVFVDTPGIHTGGGSLNKYMVDVALRAFADVDVVAVLIEAGHPPSALERDIIAKVAAAGRKCVLIINKVDTVGGPSLLPLIDECSKLATFEAILPVSALKGEGVEPLKDTLFKLLPEQQAFFPEDQLTEVHERFIAAEVIREKIFQMLQQELPYVTAVEIEKFDETNPKLLRIAAAIAVERDGQKGIVIGKGGKTLKEIGTRSRRELEAFFGTKVFLELFVKVVPDWTKKPGQLRRFGYE